MDCLELYLKDRRKNNIFTKNVASWLNQAMRNSFETEEVVLINAEPPKPAFLTRQQQKEQDELKVINNFLIANGTISEDKRVILTLSLILAITDFIFCTRRQIKFGYKI